MAGIQKVKNWWIHILIWSIYFLILLTPLLAQHSWQQAALISSISITLQVVLFYANVRYLLPQLLEKKKYLGYTFIVVLALVGSTMIHHFAHLNIIEQPSETAKHEVPNNGPRERGPRIHRAHRRGFRPIQFLFHGIPMFGVLFLSTIVRNENIRRSKDKERVDLENKVLEAESKMLKSQINPHFLFNALNNIYALAQLQSPKTPESIHKLSHLLRFVLYDTESKTIELEKEIQYIRDYMDLQLLKDEQIEKVKVEIGSINGQLKIAPMLLIPFIENCFKHSKIEDTQQGWINISIKTEKNQLEFSATNSIQAGHTRKDKVGGVGLENVRKRLDLLYQNRYALVVDEQENQYSVDLKIDLD